MSYDAADDASKSYGVAIAAMREALEACERVQIGDATLYCGDCRAILPTLGKVDAVVTDPPYGFGLYKSDVPIDVRAILAQISASVAVVFGYPEMLHGWIDGTITEWVTWWPSNAALRGRGDVLLRESEAIAFVGKVCAPSEMKTRIWKSGISKSIQKDYGLDRPKRYGDVWTDPSPGLGFNSFLRQHPNEKPLSVMQRCLGMIQVETVLDPFMGSGTTGVACAKLGRRFIGVEIERRYFDIACRRIEEAYRQPDLFIAPPAKPAEQISMDGL